MTALFLAFGAVLVADGKSSLWSFSETSDRVSSLRFRDQIIPPEFELPHFFSPSFGSGFPLS